MAQIEDFSQIQKRKRNQSIERLLNRTELTTQQKKLMQQYHRHLREKGLRLESQRAYLQNLFIFIKFFQKEPQKINAEDLDNYLKHLEITYKEKTITERKLFLIYFLEWVYDKPRSEIPLIKNLNVKKINGTKLPEEIVSPSEVKRMVQVAGTIRDKAILMLLYETAARKGEFLQLKIKHIQILESGKKQYGFITIPMGKTVSRKLPLIYSLPHLIDWLNSHPNREDQNSPLFVTQGAWLGRPLGEDGLKRIVKIMSQRANIKKNMFPHLFRHSRLTELAKELTEQELKKYAGWTPTSNMAAVYVHLSGEDVANKLLANAGLIDHKISNKEKAALLSVECPACNKLNSSDAKYCSCGKILSILEAQKEIENYKSVNEQLQEMQQQQIEILKALKLQALKEVAVQEIKKKQ